MKTVIAFTVIVYLIISIPNSHAGVAGIITYLQGECDKPDENGVRFCSSRETGQIYYVYDGSRFENYPIIKKD